jgi:hypothetical protein
MMKNKLYLVSMIAAAAMLTMTGCGEPRPAFGPEGIPAEGFLVGGGYQIRYVAPEPGVVYLVEAQKGILLGTESLSEGQAFEFYPEPDIEEAFHRVGVNLTEAQFLLYFIPESKLAHR